ncbi:proton channel OtopLc-like [Thrips palmi]|uniref:Proton channel OtopLc-like n=1 Tax=Thrips palmi TaxID=161013 RepID=A0A6P8ZL69_THRPL|nr:proton channel OtopLc-like [Thrips palmi]
METHLESPLESNALGSRRDHPFVYLQPPAPRMDRGWRRPSAPSIFHHIESALSRRLSNTGGPTVTFSPPSSPPSSPPPSSSATLPLPLRQSVFPAAPSSTAPCSAVAVRRPSAVVLLTHASPPRDEERRLMDSPDLLDRDSTTSFMPLQCDEYLKVTPKFDDTITVYLSAMYAKLLVVLGISFPILETIRSDGKYYQGFYLYLYIGTFVFLSFMYGNMLKKRAVVFVVNTYRRKESHPRPSIDSTAMGRLGSNKHYGSFYLRLGAIAFGIGSMVFSGLEFGQFFELTAECRWATQALTPAARMVLTLVQMQFIFLNNREMDMMRHKVAAQFGLMHMIATNLCEWLTVIIEEAKHEIEHLHHSFNGSGGHGGHGVHGGHSAHGHGATGHHRAVRDGHDDAANGTCVTPTDILGTLVRNASPFLFPCTVEYSLICAVVLFEMWKNTHKGGHGHGHSHHSPARDSAVSTQELGGHGVRSANHLSVDCTKAHKGLFAGIVVVVLTIICLVLYFVLKEAEGFEASGRLVVSVCELSLNIITTIAVLSAFYEVRSLKYLSKHGGLGLDNTLLVMAQVGVFLYNLFSVLGYGAQAINVRQLVTEIIGLMQAICQTIFVLDSTRRRCSCPREYRRKPGRQMVTFLLVSNMAMWLVNTLEKSQASARPLLFDFYGKWTWTLIVHISMPLAIFYRFHSTICLFEIWKCCYKLKNPSVHNGVALRKHTDSERSATN